MNAVENFLHILRFEQAERIPADIPAYAISYFGCNHEGFDAPQGDDSPVGSEWTDIWGTVWRKIHPDVMGLTRY